MNARSLFLLLALAGAGVAPAFAYDGRTVSSSTRQTAGEVEDVGVIAETDGKSDPKAVAPPPPEAKRFRLNIGIRPEWTSNAKHTGNHDSGDFLVMPNIEAGYKLPLGKGFAWDNVARIDSGIYARYDERIFLSYSLQSTLEWRPIPNAPRVFLGAEPYRLDGFDGQGRITQAIALSAGTDWGYGFNNGNSLAFVGYTFTDHFSDPTMDSRISHSGTVGLTHVIMPKLTGQVFYQFQKDNYQNLFRDDSRHIVGLTLSYQIDRHFFATLGGSWVDNDSNQPRASYQSAGVSFGINYQY